jgi:hypothetical protein
MAVVALLGVVESQRVCALSNPNGMLFRAVGVFQGPSEEGKCEVPTVTTAIVDSSNAVCRDATVVGFDTAAFRCEGSGAPCANDENCAGGETCLPTGSVHPTRMYPDRASPFGDVCGGFFELQNNLINRAVNVVAVSVRYRLVGGRFPGPVFENDFPVRCYRERKFRVGVGVRVPPVNSSDASPSGMPNTVFVQLVPIFPPQLFDCLRDPARGNASAPLLVIARLRAHGLVDGGGTIRSNPVQYTLTLLPAGSGTPGGPPDGVPVRCSPPAL